MTTLEVGFIHRLRQAERDLMAMYGLLEGIQRAVDQQTVTLAHHSVLLNGHTVRLDRVETRLEGTERRLRGVEDRLEGVVGKLGVVDTRLDGVESKLDEHGVLLTEILRRLPAAA